ncbi:MULTISPECIES: MFS transporter [Metabacillus]|jgi:sugar phosphate permease|uniref:Lysosomal dipeptide transporter MFSD1 n=1 Tax=Metabacillus rhizolycopersici TaxID=2875709 RepID=A0ABS7UMK2_9BACI|nr:MULTISPECIES: MFS transporter [Metabacillus]MBZ5749536.1 MFS transporter [Metabacillus rhizolycopersici]MCM3653312.1 MFS transporter [Metabacillus litoralis]
MDKQNSKYRWIVFATVLFTYLIIVSQRTAPGLISDQLMKDFKVTASTIGLLSSIQFFAYAGLQVPIGILSDRFGPNIFLIVGTLLTGLGTVIYSLAPNESVLLFARLIVGAGDATIWVNLVLILSQWFKGNEFIKLLGMAGMTGSLGFLMATVPFSIWISLTGWRASFFTMGIILCLCGSLLYFVLVGNPKRLMKNKAVTNLPTKKIEKNRERTLVILQRIFSNRQAWAAFLCHFGAVGTYVGFIGSWAVPFGMNVYEMTLSVASQFIMIGLIGAIIGAPLTSWISSRMNSIKKPYIVVHIILFLSWAAFLLFGGKPPVFILTILFIVIGYGNGASALTFAVVRKSFDVKEVGVASGFANMGGFLSAVLLPSIFGKVLDHFHTAESSVGYQYGFIIPVVFSIIGLIGGILIKEQPQEVTQTKELSV